MPLFCFVLKMKVRVNKSGRMAALLLCDPFGEEVSKSGSEFYGSELTFFDLKAMFEGRK